MRPLTQALLCLLLSLFWVSPLSAADQIVLFPSGNASQLPVLRAGDLSLAGSIPAPSSSFEVLQSIDGRKYYILTRRASPSIVVADSETFQVLSNIELGAAVTDAAISPDGRYILAGTGDIRVIDTTTDQAILALDVGGAPTDILFDDASTKAFVLADAGRAMSMIDMETLSVSGSLQLHEAQSMALTSNSSRLLLALPAGVQQFRTRDLSEISLIETKVQLINSTIHPLPSGTAAVIENRGTGEHRTAQFVDLDLGVALDIGNVGLTQLRQIEILDDAKGYAVDLTTNEVVLLDLTARPDIAIAPLPFGTNARTIKLSPSRRDLFVSSLTDASMLTVDTSTDAVIRSVSLPIAPDSHTLLFGPSQSAPASITINGGDNQYHPAGAQLPIPLSVRVADSLGRPIPNIPVLFDDPTGSGAVISPEQPSFTNALGIATATITLPTEEAPPPEEAVLEEGSSTQQTTPQQPPILDPLTISATTAGLDPVLFTSTVIEGSGLIKISGDNQGVDENSAFPLPMVILATDEQGFPLPANTAITLGFSKASCPTELVTDENGFITLRNCSAFPISSNPYDTQLFTAGHVTASYFTADARQIRRAFNFVVIRSGNRLGLTKLGGDNQTARSGEELPLPLSYRLDLLNGFGGTIDPFNVEFRQISGPPVVLEQRSVPSIMFREHSIKVRLGENAGTTVIEARASVPGLPVKTYTVTATGGRATSLETSGDNQSGKIAASLPSPLRVRVINESGTLVPFPEITWRVVQGDASLETSVDANGSSAVVTFGNTPGPVRIVAAIGSLQTTFTLTALAPEPASISTFSGQNQTLTTGILSDPLMVRVNEIDNRPAAGAVITFSGPPNVRLHPLDGSPPSNPVQVLADADGLAGVQAELLAVSALREAGSFPSQLTQTVTITASAGSELATSFLLNVAGRTPSFENREIVNAASFEPGLVPGSVASIFGSGLMEGVVGTEVANGQTSYRGTTVRIGGIPAPILAVSAGPPEQINVQVPFEVTPGQTTTVEIENNGSRSTVGAVPVFQAQPGIFQYTSSTGALIGAALHEDGVQLVTPENPARYGEVVSVYATGGGRVNPPVPTGTLGPAPASVGSLPVVVGVDGKGAQVLFQGYAPGLLGLYQYNFVIPPDARCGQRSINLKVGDSYSPNSTIPILCPQ